MRATGAHKQTDLVDDDVPRAAKPLVWLLASLWLPVRAAGRLVTGVLAAYLGLIETTERLLGRLWSLLRRAIARFSRPVAVLLHWIGRRLDTLRWWLTARVFAPLGRGLTAAGRILAGWAAPPVRAADRGVRRLARRLTPIARALVGRLDALGATISKLLRPVTDAARRLARAVGSAFIR